MKELIEKILSEFAKENNGVIPEEKFEEVSSSIMNLISDYRKKWKKVTEQLSSGSTLDLGNDLLKSEEGKTLRMDELEEIVYLSDVNKISFIQLSKTGVFKVEPPDCIVGETEDDLKEGSEVVFLGHNESQQSWGGCSKTEGVLIPGEIYEVAAVEVHSWHTKVYLVGIKGKFNSVQFELV